MICIHSFIWFRVIDSWILLEAWVQVFNYWLSSLLGTLLKVWMYNRILLVKEFSLVYHLMIAAHFKAIWKYASTALLFISESIQSIMQMTIIQSWGTVIRSRHNWCCTRGHLRAWSWSGRTSGKTLISSFIYAEISCLYQSEQPIIILNKK